MADREEQKSRRCTACGWGVILSWEEIKAVLGDSVGTKSDILEELVGYGYEHEMEELEVFELNGEGSVLIVDEGCAIMFNDKVGEQHAVEAAPRKEILRVAFLLGCEAKLRAVCVSLEAKDN